MNVMYVAMWYLNNKQSNVVVVGIADKSLYFCSNCTMIIILLLNKLLISIKVVWPMIMLYVTRKAKGLARKKKFCNLDIVRHLFYC